MVHLCVSSVICVAVCVGCCWLGMKRCVVETPVPFLSLDWISKFPVDSSHLAHFFHILHFTETDTIQTYSVCVLISCPHFLVPAHLDFSDVFLIGHQFNHHHHHDLDALNQLCEAECWFIQFPFRCVCVCCGVSSIWVYKLFMTHWKASSFHVLISHPQILDSVHMPVSGVFLIGYQFHHHHHLNVLIQLSKSECCTIQFPFIYLQSRKFSGCDTHTAGMKFINSWLTIEHQQLARAYVFTKKNIQASFFGLTFHLVMSSKCSVITDKKRQDINTA